MKCILQKLLTATALLAAVQMASAETLLTDDFTVTSNTVLMPNDNLTNRQTGTRALSTYNVTDGNGSGFGLQLGNTVTNVGQPGFPNNGNFLLLADNYGTQNNLVLDETLTNGAPLTFTMNLYVTSQSADLTVWNSFSLRAPGSSFPVAGAGEFGFLNRVNGGFQAFSNGGAIADLPAGTLTGSFFTFTFSDTAGTGSAFAGNGSRVVVLNEGNVVLDYDFDGGNLSSGLLFGFNGVNGATAGVDNLSITAVPEPSTYGLVMMAVLVGGSILTRRCSRRV